MEKSIIIIGAGIAGLSAGCYGQMNGYRTQIFEMDRARPGGLCTTWKRKGYKIDGCIHWLTGSSPGNPFYRMWQEVGAVQGRTMINHDELTRIEGKDGRVFIVYTDLNRLAQHMKELAPEDTDVIEEFINAALSCTRLNVPIEKAPELLSPSDMRKMMPRMSPYLELMGKWGNVSLLHFTQRFKNPFLREVFPLIQDLPDIPMMVLLTMLAIQHNKAAGYPLGGSLEFALAIERRYRNLGGEVHYKSPVVKILVENNRAVGVRLADGSEHRSDIVVSAADGHTTIFDMLEGKYVNEEIRDHYDQLPLIPPLIYIALGVSRSFDELPHSVEGINFPLDIPITVDGQEWKRLQLQFYNFDPSFAPEGKTLLVVMGFSNYEYWKKLSQDPERYKAKKEQIADQVVAQLDRRFPGLAAQVEMRDVATPMTYERYTGNWKGAYEGWQTSTKTISMSMNKTLPGLDDFYMAGQWVMPGGGLPMAVLSGRYVTQIICKKDKKPFIAMVP